MPNLTLKNIPDPLYRRLKRSAELHRRSLNSEILACLERALDVRTEDPVAQLQRIDRLREEFGLVGTDEEIRQAIQSGRP